MVLRPRKFKFKNRQKNRQFLYPKNSHLNYGQIGLQILSPLKLFSKQIYRFKMFVKKGSRRADRTRRFV